MTENKVTSFEISKRLLELGFECQSHCGWWIQVLKDNSTELIWVYALRYTCDDGGDIPNKVPAYDCHDLLCSEILKEILSNGLAFIGNMFMVQYWDKNGKSIGIDFEPQNALGLAIIEILESNLVNSTGFDKRRG